MSEFSCSNCLREFARKDYLKKHLSRKKPCKKNEFLSLGKSKVSLKVSLGKSKVSLNSEKKEEENGYECLYCKKVYKHKQSRYKHMKICKEKKKQITITNCNNVTNNNNNNITNNINIVNNINIRPFGKENFDSITKKDIIYILNKCYMSFPNALKKIHYDIPENRNFYQPNKNRKYIKYYNGKNWIYENEKKFNTELSYKLMIIIERWYDTYESRIKETRQEMISRMFDDFNNGKLEDNVDNFCEKYLFSYSNDIKTYMDEQIKKIK